MDSNDPMVDQNEEVGSDIEAEDLGTNLNAGDVANDADAEAMGTNADVETAATDMDGETLETDLGAETMGTNMNVEGMGTNMNVEGMGSNMNVEGMGTNMNVEGMGTNMNVEGMGTNMNVEGMGTNMEISGMGTNMNMEVLETNVDAETMGASVNVEDLETSVGVEGLETSVGVEGLETNVGVEGLETNVGVDDLEGNVGVDGMATNVDIEGMGTNIGVEGMGTNVDAESMANNVDVEGLGTNVDAEDLEANVDVEGMGTGVDAGDMGTNVVQWATLGPQNTLITFQTLPLGFQPMEGGTAIAISEAPDLSALGGEKLQTGMLPDPEAHSHAEVGAVSLEQGKMPVPVPVASFLAQAVGSKSQTLGAFPSYQSCLSSQPPHKAPASSVFTSVSATLSPLLMDTIAGSQAILLQQVQMEPGLELNIQDNAHFTITGSLEMVMRVHNRMKEALGEADKLHFCNAFQEPDVTKSVSNKGVTCDLLVPFISSHGRQVRKPARYSGCMQLGFGNGTEFGDDSEEEVGDEDERFTKRRRRGPQVRRATPRNDDIAAPPSLQAPQQLLAEDCEVPAVEIKVENSLEQAEGDESAVSTSMSVRSISRKGRHRKDYEAQAPFKFRCSKCSFKTKRESHYRRHLKYHERDNVSLHRCSKCSFVTIRFSHLRRHEVEHSKHVFGCPHCKYRTDRLMGLERHLRYKHKPQKPLKPQYTCSECNFVTQQKARYDWHVLKHLQAASGSPCLTEEEEKNYKCSACVYVTMRREHLQRHMENVHGNLRPYLCDLCGKAFKRPDALSQHKFTHQSRDARRLPHHCNHCNKAFRSQAHLKEHMSMHTSERPYLCHHCGAAFKTPGVQRRHIASIHLNPRAFDCGSCSKRFNTKYALVRHQRTHAPPVLAPEVVLERDEEEAPLMEEGDAMQTSMEETLVPAESLQHPYMAPSETTEALLFLENVNGLAI